MSFNQKNYLSVPSLEAIPFLVHGFGTKNWMNSDFEKIAALASFKRVSLKQTHSDIVRIIRAVPDRPLEGDAMITDRPGILLIITTADCLPVFLVDVVTKVIAAVHCGWAGTKKRVLQKTLKTMISEFGCVSESVHAAMGPCISSRCYEVGDDVLAEFVQAGFPRILFQKHPRKKDKYLLDLTRSNRLQLTECGVLEGNIASVDLCTHCDDSLLSYRRDRQTQQRLMNFIGLILQDI